MEIILLRPQSSENVGAVARAMKNFGLGRLVLVAPPRLDRQRAGTLAVHAEEILDSARLAPTLEEAIAPLSLVVPTTDRALEGRAPPLSPREVAGRFRAAGGGRVGLLFGAEASGLTLSTLARFPEYSSIPTDPRRTSLNLAQAVLLYAWELFQEAQAEGPAASERAPPRGLPEPEAAPAPQRLVSLLRERARTLLLGAGFLNPQAPDPVLDELLRLLQRAEPTSREVELLLAALAQLQRTSAVAPRR